MDSEIPNGAENIKPAVLYHSSPNTEIGEFEPRSDKVRDPNEGPRIFATPDKALASAFIVPTDGSWVNIGRFNEVPYIIISDEQRFKDSDKGGAIYHLPSNTFETDLNKGMKSSEWTSRVPVKPIDKDIYKSGLEAMLSLGVQVYFVDTDTLHRINESADHGYSIVNTLPSENQKLNINPKPFE